MNFPSPLTLIIDKKKNEDGLYGHSSFSLFQKLHDEQLIVPIPETDEINHSPLFGSYRYEMDFENCTKPEPENHEFVYQVDS